MKNTEKLFDLLKDLNNCGRECVDSVGSLFNYSSGIEFLNNDQFIYINAIFLLNLIAVMAIPVFIDKVWVTKKILLKNTIYLLITGLFLLNFYSAHIINKYEVNFLTFSLVVEEISQQIDESKLIDFKNSQLNTPQEKCINSNINIKVNNENNKNEIFNENIKVIESIVNCFKD